MDLMWERRLNKILDFEDKIEIAEMFERIKLNEVGLVKLVG